jgi:hypothetical protein
MQFSENGLVGVLKRCCTMGADLTRGMYGLKAITSTVAPQAGTARHRNSSRLPKDFRKELHSRILLGSSQQAKNGE